MSRLPQLEAQLVAAAAVRPKPRRAPARVAAGLLAAACAAASVLAFAPRHEAVPAPVAEGVPPATLALSHALTEAPRPVTDIHDPIPHAELPGVAAEIEARTPYPPGVRDDFDWAGTSADPRSMSSVNFRPAVQFLVEYRSYCLWLRYWLTGADPRGAAAVIEDIPRWPTQRQPAGIEADYQARIVAAVRRGDAAPVRREHDLNCGTV